MTIDSKVLLAKIEEHPGTGVYRLADWLDRPVDEVQTVIDEQILSGNVVVHIGAGPNGKECSRFTIPGVGLPPSAAPAPEESDAEQDAIPEKDTTPGLTHYERARNYIMSRPKRTATGAQLHALMGLKADQYPSTFLKGALDRGWLIKTGKEWFIGLDGTEASKPRAPAADAHRSPHIVQPEAGAGAANAGVIREYVEAGDVVDAEFDPPFQCAVWSDGQLQLVRNGETTELLSYDETSILYDYLRRIDMPRRP